MSDKRDAGDARREDVSHRTAPKHYNRPGGQWLIGDFIRRAGLPFDEGSAVKYVCRHATSEGAVDLLKAIEYIGHVLRIDYGIKIEVKREEAN